MIDTSVGKVSSGDEKMSMRIGNSGEGSFVDSTRSSATKAAGLDSKNITDSSASFGTDRVNLSNAGSLIALAKSSGTSTDRASKLATLAAQVSSGTYSASSSDIGKALIRGYTKAR
jgi:anti-sigma28 factor (negative regulator of flagellin synthesis)